MRNVHDRVAGAVMRVMGEVSGLDGPALVLMDAVSTPWASVTFSGARHRLVVTLHEGSKAALKVVLDRLLPSLPEAEIPLAGEIVADLTMEIGVLGESEAGCFAELVIEVLTVRD